MTDVDVLVAFYLSYYRPAIKSVNFRHSCTETYYFCKTKSCISKIIGNMICIGNMIGMLMKLSNVDRICDIDL